MRHSRLICSHLSRIHKTLPQNPKSKPSLKSPNLTRQLATTASPSQQQQSNPLPLQPPLPSNKVAAIVNEISALTLLEISDLTEVLRQKLDIKEMPVMAVMLPGMGFSGLVGASMGGRGAAAAAAKAEEKAEKTVFDVKLEGFDAAAKIKVIKEVRGFTDLGLKEAKELVEKAPTLLKKGVTKEEAENIINKMKAAGAKVTMD